jgi:hypothetical protein
LLKKAVNHRNLLRRTATQKCDISVCVLSGTGAIHNPYSQPQSHPSTPYTSSTTGNSSGGNPSNSFPYSAASAAPPPYAQHPASSSGGNVPIQGGTGGHPHVMAPQLGPVPGTLQVLENKLQNLQKSSMNAFKQVLFPSFLFSLVRNRLLLSENCT